MSIKTLAVYYCLLVWLSTAPFPLRAADTNDLDRTATQWAPFVEWQLKNASHEGNPFDLDAKATFIHEESGEQRTTGMFYDGKVWRFRFTATRPGIWKFSTSSSDSDLEGHRGTVTVKPNDNGYGFVTHVREKWARPVGQSGKLEAFVPQFVMYNSPDRFYGKPELIDTTSEWRSSNTASVGFMCRLRAVGSTSSTLSHRRFRATTRTPIPGRSKHWNF
jgi:hypothetical protein